MSPSKTDPSSEGDNANSPGLQWHSARAHDYASSDSHAIQDDRKWLAPFLPRLPSTLELNEENDYPVVEISLSWAALLKIYQWRADGYGRTFEESDFLAAADAFHRLDQSLTSWHQEQCPLALRPFQTPALRELESSIAAGRALIASGEAFFSQEKNPR